MSFEYGSASLGITNPFKIEGKVLIISGALISLIGMYLLIGVSSALKISAALGWKDTLVGIMILIWGIGTIGFGILKISRFYVGRSAPASLAKNMSENLQENNYYNSQILESMLVGRKNVTFEEPSNIIQRVLYNLLPNLLFTPPPVYNLLIDLTKFLAKIAGAFFIFSILWFVANVGLLGDSGMKLNSFISFLLLATLVYFMFDISKKSYTSKMFSKIKTWGSLSILAVFGLMLMNSVGENGTDLMPVYFNAWPSMIIFLVSSIAVFALAWLITKEREYGQTKTEVSEYRENIQESIHPKELMIHLENIILANRRYKELPNRTYQKPLGHLQSENNDKGHFNTQALIETQPEFIQTEYSTSFAKTRMMITILAQVFIVISAVLIAWLSHVMSIESVTESLTKILTLLFAALVLYSSGNVLERISHMFWSELRFKSLLLWMKMDGTFTESKISTGMAVYDSNRSENTVVRSSITNWLICSRITSATFAESGIDNVEGMRFVYEMEKDDIEMQNVMNEFKEFLESRENIAGMSKKDLENSASFNAVNQTPGSIQAGYFKMDTLQPTHIDVIAPTAE